MSFQDNTVCYQCQRSYDRPNSDQPLCNPCHTLYLCNIRTKRLRAASDKVTSLAKYFRLTRSRQQVQPPPEMRAEPLQGLRFLPARAHASPARLQQLKELREMLDQYRENEEKNKTLNQSDDESDPEANSSNVAIASKSCDEHCYYFKNKSDTKISVLPVEILLQIFSYLDDLTLMNNVGKVSKQWKAILESDQRRWEYFTKKRWPLLRIKEEIGMTMADAAAGRTRSINWYRVSLKVFFCLIFTVNHREF